MLPSAVGAWFGFGGDGPRAVHNAATSSVGEVVAAVILPAHFLAMPQTIFIGRPSCREEIATNVDCVFFDTDWMIKRRKR